TRVLPPMEAAALDAVRRRVPGRRRRAPDLVHVAVMDLALHLAVVVVTAEPDLEYGREPRVLTDHDVVAALRARNHVREERDAVERERAVARLDDGAAVLLHREPITAAEPIAQRRPGVSDDPDRLAGKDVRERRCARRSRCRTV